jgi:hypothetical protein
MALAATVLRFPLSRFTSRVGGVPQARDFDVRPLCTSDMSDVYVRVFEKWKSAGLSLAPPLERAVIEQRFQTASLDVGSDFVEFLVTVGGMTDSEEDSDLWSCWSIEKILREAQSYKREGVLFADWCIHSHIHLVRRDSATRSSVWVDFFSDDEPQKVSDSLEDFLERYLAKAETTYVFFDALSIRKRVA